jgi:hypothetical protein
MRRNRKEPLYRKVNTRVKPRHRLHDHREGGDYKHTRNGKKNRLPEATMKKGVLRGLDYTPLYRFLISRAGKPWGPTLKEATSRLDRQEPIFRLVSLSKEDADEWVRTHENSYFSGLYVDEDGILRKTNPDLCANDFAPSCPCCTHTFNGVPLGKPFVPRESQIKVLLDQGLELSSYGYKSISSEK